MEWRRHVSPDQPGEPYASASTGTCTKSQVSNHRDVSVDCNMFSSLDFNGRRKVHELGLSRISRGRGSSIIPATKNQDWENAMI